MLRVWTPKKKVFHVFAMLKVQLKLLKGTEVHRFVKPATIEASMIHHYLFTANFTSTSDLKLTSYFVC